MHFCGFCGKGPFPASSALNKHIRHSTNCNKAACQKWGTYATKIWDGPPGVSKAVQQPPPSPPILEQDELHDMPDITLEEDLHGLEDLTNTQPHTITGLVPERLESAYYIQEFPPNLGAGAVWGEEVPFFEKLWQEPEQVQNGSSRWGPFDDQNEWELAQWLIRNIGHNQTNSFLNLNIVTSHLLNFDCDRSLMVIW